MRGPCSTGRAVFSLVPLFPIDNSQVYPITNLVTRVPLKSNTLLSPMVLFGLGSVAYFCLLLINSVAILNKERFLVPLGLTTSTTSIPGSGTHTPSTGGGGPAGGSGGGYGVTNQYDAYAAGQLGAGGPGSEDGLKSRLVQLVDAVRTLMRIPLIPINIVVIVYELIFG